MNRNLNRRKFYIFQKTIIYFSIIFTILLLSIYYFNSQKIYILNNLTNIIEKFSENFQYQYTNFDVNDLNNVRYSFIENELKKYYQTSIFLLPLEKISNQLKENSWIRNVKLTTNYKDTLFVNIQEYKALGIYNFNNKLFYFDNYGKIIEEVNTENDNINNHIIFSGKYSNLKAALIIKILENLDFKKKFKVKEIIFIKQRRWDIIINNDIKLMLSENEPKKSIENFIIIEKNLSETDFNNIKYFDLRNTNKTLITYN